MSRVLFFYFNGTDPIISKVASWLGQLTGQPSLGLLSVPGLAAGGATWLDGTPSNDPFCKLLDPQIMT